MTKKEAIRLAIKKAKEMEGNGSVCVHRIGKRQFEVREYLVPFTQPIVVIHVSWAKDGWYDKYKPDWVGEELES